MVKRTGVNSSFSMEVLTVNEPLRHILQLLKIRGLRYCLYGWRVRHFKVGVPSCRRTTTLLYGELYINPAADIIQVAKRTKSRKEQQNTKLPVSKRET